ncbi:kunitz-type U19-barytoxin-Tl1a [Caerostris darwini]|uniref:Kunitz-type U19-barytoxin-Tl1a n=1 Tax=Caerostris darwini TaxID=1538125 RepID=A0AAV4N125_9ARAC|nr:kunitz-type U19-barytoxin-Tl1a [Caerostris darwini]
MKLLLFLCFAGTFGLFEATNAYCPPNSKYQSCGTACALTCENYKNPPTACAAICNPGCQCDQGYVKTKDGKCVLPQNCPGQEVCGENELYTECGTACPLTCENHKNSPTACAAICIRGCHCDEDYVKTKDGKCDLPQNCPGQGIRIVPPNSKYQSCGTACALTCENYKNPPTACAAICNPGCQCDQGYVKTKDGKCVLPQNCPGQEVCGKNERYTECGTACPLTCDNYDNPLQICTLQCKVGCECQDGFVRNAYGKCVLPKECPRCAEEESNCHNEPDGDMCLGYFPMWYYDERCTDCKEFVYGGCGGNGNRYGSKAECLKSCAPKPQKPNQRDTCDLPAETGRCRGYFSRFYFYKASGKCKSFV